jgi:hypothetical protein
VIIIKGGGGWMDVCICTLNEDAVRTFELSGQSSQMTYTWLVGLSREPFYD